MSSVSPPSLTELKSPIAFCAANTSGVTLTNLPRNSKWAGIVELTPEVEHANEHSQWRRRRGGRGGSCPPTFQRGGAEPPHFRAFLTSHAMNRFINASKEAIHLPVVQKLVAVAACESFTTRNRSTSCDGQYTVLLCRTRTYTTILGHQKLLILIRFSLSHCRSERDRTLWCNDNGLNKINTAT